MTAKTDVARWSRYQELSSNTPLLTTACAGTESPHQCKPGRRLSKSCHCCLCHLYSDAARRPRIRITASLFRQASRKLAHSVCCNGLWNLFLMPYAGGNGNWAANIKNSCCGFERTVCPVLQCLYPNWTDDLTAYCMTSIKKSRGVHVCGRESGFHRVSCWTILDGGEEYFVMRTVTVEYSGTLRYNSSTDTRRVYQSWVVVLRRILHLNAALSPAIPGAPSAMKSAVCPLLMPCDEIGNHEPMIHGWSRTRALYFVV